MEGCTIVVVIGASCANPLTSPPGTFRTPEVPDVPWRPLLTLSPPSPLYKDHGLTSEATCYPAFDELASLFFFDNQKIQALNKDGHGGADGWEHQDLREPLPQRAGEAALDASRGVGDQEQEAGEGGREGPAWGDPWRHRLHQDPAGEAEPREKVNMQRLQHQRLWLQESKSLKGSKRDCKYFTDIIYNKLFQKFKWLIINSFFFGWEKLK